MESNIQCYDAALYDTLVANGYYKSALIELAGYDGFMMRKRDGEWAMYIVYSGLMCEIAHGDGFDVIPMPPNL